MDKREFYLGLAMRLFIGFLLIILTISCWQFQKIILEDPTAGWLVFTGVPMFVLFGLVFLIGFDILWAINFILWIIMRKSKKKPNEDENDKTVYLP